MKKRKLVKFINKSVKTKCWSCKGTGYRDNICNEKYACDSCPVDPCKNTCKACEGTGKWKEPNYHLIATTPNGQKIGFSVDQGGK